MPLAFFFVSLPFRIYGYMLFLKVLLLSFCLYHLFRHVFALLFGFNRPFSRRFYDFDNQNNTTRVIYRPSVRARRSPAKKSSVPKEKAEYIDYEDA